MTDSKDPFDFDDEEDRTVIQRLNPGGRKPADGSGNDPAIIKGGAAASPSPTTKNDALPDSVVPAGAQQREAPQTPLQRVHAARTGAQISASPIEIESANRLMAGGARLLGLAGALRGTVNHEDVGRLREKIAEELTAFEKTSKSRGASDQEAQLGHYVLCALLDDVVMATPWGAREGWSKRSLTAHYHNQVDSGDKLYTLVTRLQQNPGQHANVLELIYAALSLGFEGRMRMVADGRNQHEAVRTGIYETLRNLQPDPEADLSRKWRGADTGYKPLAQKIPAWVYGAGLALIGALLFTGMLFSLDRKAETALAGLSEVVIPDIGSPTEKFVQTVVDKSVYEEVAGILDPDIQAGRVEVFDFPNRIEVRLLSLAGGELFGSGSANMSPDYRATIKRISDASKVTGGKVHIKGHSDSQPIKTQRFRSNWELSTARAQTIGRLLSLAGGEPDRFSAEGLGPDDPIGDNSTADGRRLNRRVEVVLQK